MWCLVKVRRLPAVTLGALGRPRRCAAMHVVTLGTIKLGRMSRQAFAHRGPRMAVTANFRDYYIKSALSHAVKRAVASTAPIGLRRALV